MTNRRLFIICIAILLAVVVLCVAFAAIASAAPADTCDPAYTAQCCACEPSGDAEPAQLPQLWLPTVQRSMPAMAAEYTPAQPMPTPEPDVELPLGDASQ